MTSASRDILRPRIEKNSTQSYMAERNPHRNMRRTQYMDTRFDNYDSLFIGCSRKTIVVFVVGAHIHRRTNAGIKYK